MPKQILRLIICINLLLSPSLALAIPPHSPYLPGETIAPNCTPGEAYCTVSTSTPYYNNSTETLETANLLVDNATTTNLWVGSLTGVLRALSGYVTVGLVNLASEVAGVLPIINGGTGTSSVPLPGSLLVGNASGGYTIMATSSLGLPLFSDLHQQISLTGQSYLTLNDQEITIGQINLSGSHATGTLASALLSGTYSQALTLSNSSNSFSGIGSGLTDLNGDRITSGVIGAAFGGTGLTSYTRGDLLFASTSNALGLLSPAQNGNILLISGQGVPAWMATSSLGIIFSDIQGVASQLQIPLDLEIDGGSIENTTIGLNVPSTAFFTGLTAANATTTNSRTNNLTVTGVASTSVLNISNSLSLGSSTGILKSAGGAISAVATSAVSLASDVAGVLSPSNGGTGLINIQAGAMLYGNGTGALATTSLGANGQVLAQIGGLPTWVATTTFSGALTYSGGNVTINAGAIANNLLANSGINVSAGAGLSGGGSTALGSTATLSLNTGNTNYWTGLQSFSQASTSLLSVKGSASFGSVATSSFDNLGRLTLANIGVNTLLSVDASGLVAASSTPTVAAIIASSTSATSTLAGGLTVGGTKLIVDRVTGSVGIGGNPNGNALSVVGKISASLGFNGTCYSGLSILGFTLLGCNQDVAEVYSAYELTEPGDIVALPPPEEQTLDDSGVVLVGRARSLGGEVLLGVVSMNPGLVFNNGRTYLAGANDEMITSTSTVIALAGRVPVKVSLENGPIRAGDKLTISPTRPGVAVRAVRPGVVVGTALQSYDGGELAMVLMFIDLHWDPISNDEEGLFDSFTNAVRWSLSQFGLVIENGLAMFDKVRADRLETKELCIEDICIGKDQLQNLLKASTITPLSATPMPNAALNNESLEVSASSSEESLASEEINNTDDKKSQNGSIPETFIPAEDHNPNTAPN